MLNDPYLIGIIIMLSNNIKQDRIRIKYNLMNIYVKGINLKIRIMNLEKDLDQLIKVANNFEGCSLDKWKAIL